MRKFNLALTALATAFAASSASAAITVNINDSGPNVVATVSGSLNLAGLTDQGSFFNSTFIRPVVGFIGFGTGNIEGFSGLTGPTNFGSGAVTNGSSSVGDLFAINSSSFGSPYVFFTSGYSGSAISATDTWFGASIASLGATPGQYVYTAANHDTVTINIGGAVPEPSTWAMMLLGFAGIGFAMRR